VISRILLLLVLLAAGLAGQDKPSPGLLTGIVLETGTENPVHKVTLYLIRQQAEDSNSEAVLTGMDGRFRFENLAPGTYFLQWSKPGWSTGGQGQGGRQIQIAKEPLEPLRIEMSRAGAVSGRVLDPDGDPAAYVTVSALSARGAARRGFTANSALTDERGEYRLFNLPPGRYLVQAIPQQRMQFPNMRRFRGAGGRGAELASTGATYYPGVTESPQAARLDIKSGDELRGIDIQLQTVTPATVSGVVVGLPEGSTVRATVTAMQTNSNPMRPFSTAVRRQKPEFELNGLEPGRYVIIARSFEPGGAEEGQLEARTLLDVPPGGLSGVRLELSRPLKIEGRVVPPEGKALPEGLMLALSPVTEEGLFGSGSGVIRLKADGAFTIPRVSPGEYWVRVSTPPPSAAQTNTGEYFVDSLRLGNERAQGDVVRLIAGIVEPLTIRLADRPGSLAVTVQFKEDTPSEAVTVLALPDHLSFPSFNNPLQCRIEKGGPASCSLSGLRPGKYKVLAFDARDVIYPFGAAALRPYFEQAKAVEVKLGETTTLELAVVATEEQP
jgi:5-hydroxyisourate hydrolase-like protein (transthyretin family)